MEIENIAEIMQDREAKIFRLNGDNASFSMKNGFLTLKTLFDGKEKSYSRVFLHRAFPFEMTDKFISVLDDCSSEIGIIYDISDFCGDQSELIERELERKYYSPKIKSVNSVKERYGYSFWKVTLYDGRDISFTVRDTYRQIIHAGEDRIFICDVDGNRFEIENLSSLDRKSYRRIELYL